LQQLKQNLSLQKTDQKEEGDKGAKPLFYIYKMEPDLRKDENYRTYDVNARLTILDLLLDEMGNRYELEFTSIDVLKWMSKKNISLQWSKTHEKLVYMRLHRLHKNGYLKREKANKKDKWDGFPKGCRYVYLIDKQLKDKIENYIAKVMRNRLRDDVGM